MQIGTMKESKYIKKEDCGDNGLLVTIKSIDETNVAMDNQPADMKHIMFFEELPKPMVLNWTNIQLCAQAAGSTETNDWPGKQIVIFNDPTVAFGGELKGGIRIRSAQQTQPASPAQAAAPAASAGVAQSAVEEDDIPF